MQFKYALKEESSGEEKKDYMLNAGSTMTRIIGGVKGAIINLQHVSYIGPKSLNGGEVVISKGEYTCVGARFWRVNARTLIVVKIWNANTFTECSIPSTIRV